MGSVVATLKQRGGAVVAEIPLPQSLADVPLSRFIDFLVECRALSDSSDETRHLIIMCRAISAFTGIEFEKIVTAKVGDLYRRDIAGLQDSISGLFGYIANLISNAGGEMRTPESAAFVYKGDAYHMPVILQQALQGEYALPFVSVIEAVEAAEIQRLKSQQTKEQGDPDGSLKRRIMAIAEAEAERADDATKLRILKAAEKTVATETERQGDPDGSLLYSMYLRTLAVLARKEGENMPLDDAQRERWINDRAFHFQEIDAQTALDVDFFLTNILNACGNTLPAIGFLSRQSFAVVAEMRLRSVKHMKGRSNTMKPFFAV